MEERFCQSCGMPMGQTDERYGTEADGTKSKDYCSYCYTNGAFPAECTMQEMIDLCVQPMLENIIRKSSTGFTFGGEEHIARGEGHLFVSDHRDIVLDGALLHTQYGKGDFVYCSLALYRQLRVGNPGAARLLVNLLALCRFLCQLLHTPFGRCRVCNLETFFF